MMCTKIIEFTDEKLKLKVQIEDEFIYIMNKSVSRIFIWYWIYRHITQKPVWFKFCNHLYTNMWKSSFDDFSAKHTPCATLKRYSILPFLDLISSLLNASVKFIQFQKCHLNWCCLYPFEGFALSILIICFVYIMTCTYRPLFIFIIEAHLHFLWPSQKGRYLTLSFL